MSLKESLIKKVREKTHILDPVLYKGMACFTPCQSNKTFMYLVTSTHLVLSDGEEINEVIRLDDITEIKLSKIDKEVLIVDKVNGDFRFNLLDYDEFDAFFEWFKKSDLVF